MVQKGVELLGAKQEEMARNIVPDWIDV